MALSWVTVGSARSAAQTQSSVVPHSLNHAVHIFLVASLTLHRKLCMAPGHLARSSQAHRRSTALPQNRMSSGSLCCRSPAGSTSSRWQMWRAHLAQCLNRRGMPCKSWCHPHPRYLQQGGNSYENCRRDNMTVNSCALAYNLRWCAKTGCAGKGHWTHTFQTTAAGRLFDTHIPNHLLQKHT